MLINEDNTEQTHTSDQQIVKWLCVLFDVGKRATYSGGGYVVELSQSQENSTVLIQHLMDSNWIDERTRGVMIELTVYNANVNLFRLDSVFDSSSNWPSKATLLSVSLENNQEWSTNLSYM